MGTVYAATDTVTGARVAVKIVSAAVAENEVLRNRFEREVRVVRALETPHVVRIFDAGRDAESGLPFFVMEVLEGDDIAFVLKRFQPLRPDLALRIGAQACAGLEAAHDARIVHRDIKPSNLFLAKGLTADERIVKILDFGIAKQAPEPSGAGAAEATNLTKTGSMLGSPLYMAPEQARGQKNIDVRADIWSLGVVLYQALTGRTPHPYTDAIGDMIITICTEPAPRIEHIAPWVPPHVVNIVHRALEINPAARFQSISEMRSALLACLSGDPRIFASMLVTIPESERVLLMPHVETNHSVQEFSMPGGSVPKRPHPGVLIAAMAAFAVSGGLLSYFALRKDPAASTIQTRDVTTNAAPASSTSASGAPTASIAEAAALVSAPLQSASAASGQSTTKTIPSATPRGTQPRKPPAPNEIYLGR